MPDKGTPCDVDGRCPFATEHSATGMYFCRDMCGLGVDESGCEEEHEEEEYEDA